MTSETAAPTTSSSYCRFALVRDCSKIQIKDLTKDPAEQDLLEFDISTDEGLQSGLDQINLRFLLGITTLDLDADGQVEQADLDRLGSLVDIHDFIVKNFFVLAGTSNILEAEIVYFGPGHQDLLSLDKISVLLREVGRPGDIVLLAGVAEDCLDLSPLSPIDLARQSDDLIRTIGRHSSPGKKIFILSREKNHDDPEILAYLLRQKSLVLTSNAVV